MNHKLLSLPILSALLGLACSPVIGQQSFEEWLKQDQDEFAAYNAEVTAAYDKFMKEEAAAFAAFMKAAGATWGKDNVWVPEQKSWVQYREDLEERSSVDLEDGVARLQVIVPDDAGPDIIAEAVSSAVETLVLSGSLDPIEMMRRRLFSSSKESDRVEHKQTNEPLVYTVQQGDSLWKVSRKFKVSRQEIARANGIDPDGWLKTGQKLTIPGLTEERSAKSASVPAPATNRDPRLAASGSRPLLDKQVTMPDGSPVTQKNANQFGRHVATSGQMKSKQVTGEDGKQRRVVTAEFGLVPDHVRVRAERFRPLVSKYCAEHGVYPPLVYAIMHSESSFNPRARSGVPAFGLMQLVPRSGARDAYRYVYNNDKLVSGSNLYDPAHNNELGTALLHILSKRYFRRVTNPANQMLCSIAAYNTGAGNVCKAFGAGTSLSRAAPIINSMEPAEVYARLRRDLPYEETRNYVKKVNDRMPMYRGWR